MKKIITIIPIFAGFLAYVVFSSNSNGLGVVAGVERTGATGTITGCGAGCHASPAGSSITDTIRLLHAGVPVTTYTPGLTYTVHITGANTSTSTSVILPRCGFQLTAVKTSTITNAGTFTTSAGTHTVTPVSGVVVVEHSTPILPATGSGSIGSTYVIDVPWTAPTAGTGSVTFRSVINAVNYDSTNGGDVFKNASLVVSESPTAVSNTNAITEGMSIYPNPSNGFFNLMVESNKDEPVYVFITDLSGRKVDALTMHTNSPTELKINQPPGLFIVFAKTETNAYSTIVNIQ